MGIIWSEAEYTIRRFSHVYSDVWTGTPDLGQEISAINLLHFDLRNEQNTDETDTWYEIYQSGLRFDTTGLSGSEIGAIQLDFYLALFLAIEHDVTVEVRAYDWGPTATTADYRSAATTPAWADCPLVATLDLGPADNVDRRYVLTDVDIAGNLNLGGLTHWVVGRSDYGTVPPNWDDPNPTAIVGFWTSHPVNATVEPGVGWSSGPVPFGHVADTRGARLIY